MVVSRDNHLWRASDSNLYPIRLNTELVSPFDSIITCSSRMCYICQCLWPKKKKDRSEGKKKRRNAKTTLLTGNDTKWVERLPHEPDLTPSQIEDGTFSNNIQLGSSKFTNRFKLFKDILEQTQYEMVGDSHFAKGGYSKIYKIRDKTSKKLYALKVMRLTSKDIDGGKSSNKLRLFKEEVFSLTKIKHKNIIEIKGHYIIASIFISFMVLELATEGDLKHKLEDEHQRTKKGFKEKDSQSYFAQISNAINCVHNNNISHRDLKLENILVTKIDGKEVIKVTDFGCARVTFKPDEVEMADAAGTITYMAPEALKVYLCNKGRADLLERPVMRYNPIRADMWSLGVCLYRMLYFVLPFDFNKSKRIESISSMIKEMKKGFTTPEGSDKFSDDCLQLLSGLLDYDKDNRLNIAMVMNNPWVKSSPESDSYGT